MRKDITASLPRDLYEADDILTRYGRWAAAEGGPRTCGSAEGQYRAPAGEALEARRTPAFPLTNDEKRAAARALSHIPGSCRDVLKALYVPQTGATFSFAVRQLGLPLSVVQERHLRGLRLWWDAYCHQLDAVS